MTAPDAARDPVEDLRRIAFLLERTLESSYRVKAFRTAAAALAALGRDDVALLASTGGLRGVKGIGERTARGRRAVGRRRPAGVPRRSRGPRRDPARRPSGADLRAPLRGDLHMHSDWSDGGSPIAEMAAHGALARARVHRPHRPLPPAHRRERPDRRPPEAPVGRRRAGERRAGQREQRERRAQRERRERANGDAFRLLAGIEVDILSDGALDQTDDLLDRLDVVVASVHSELRMPRRRDDPADARGGREPAHRRPRALHRAVCDRPPVRRTIVSPGAPAAARPGRSRSSTPSGCSPPAPNAASPSRSTVAPERLDPPLRLLRLAVAAGCLFALDTDAHAPGQLDWQPLGCAARRVRPGSSPTGS